MARSPKRATTLLLCATSVLTLILCGQNDARAQVYTPNQEIRIPYVPSLTAKSPRASDVLAASLEIVFQDAKVCCGKNSALEESVQSADPTSLQDISNKVQGKHLLSDGRPIMITAEYFAAGSVSADWLINSLREKHALLMEWNSHLYVVSGVLFDQTVNEDSPLINAIHKIFLLDPRFSDARREVSFDRLTNDWGKVQGILMLKAVAQ